MIDGSSDEEWPHLLHELGGVPRRAHVLDQLREGVKLWPEESVTSLDLASTEVLERLTDPTRREANQSKGLVVGYVKSGKTANITGYVTKVDWVNPHAFVFIDSKDESGTVRNYQVEMGPPYALVRGGWKRDTLKVGDKVTVEGAALAKNGSDKAGSDQPTRMVLANGQKLVMR